MFQFFQSLHDLPVHERQKSAFLNTIMSDRIHHAYILYGDNGAGKLAFSLMMAKHLLCKTDSYNTCNQCSSCSKMNKLSHPDLQLIFPTNKKNDDADPKSIERGLELYRENPFSHYSSDGSKSIFVESIRKIKSNAKYAAAESKYKIYIIHEAEYMNDASANAFLKVMEEPPENTLIIMTSSNIDKMLSTIRSRAQKLFFQRPHLESLFQVIHKYYPDLNENDLRLKVANGNFSKAFQYIEQNIDEIRSDMLNFLRFTIVNKPIQLNQIIDKYIKKHNKDNINDFLTMIETWFRDISLLQSGLESSDLINIDLLNELSKFSQRYKDIDYLEIINLLETIKNDIIRNVHLGLCLNTLSIKLRELII